MLRSWLLHGGFVRDCRKLKACKLVWCTCWQVQSLETKKFYWPKTERDVTFGGPFRDRFSVKRSGPPGYSPTACLPMIPAILTKPRPATTSDSMYVFTLLLDAAFMHYTCTGLQVWVVFHYTAPSESIYPASEAWRNLQINLALQQLYHVHSALQLFGCYPRSLLAWSLFYF